MKNMKVVLWNFLLFVGLMCGYFAIGYNNGFSSNETFKISAWTLFTFCIIVQISINIYLLNRFKYSSSLLYLISIAEIALLYGIVVWIYRPQ